MADIIYQLGHEHHGYRPLPTPRASLTLLAVSIGQRTVTLVRRCLSPFVLPVLDHRIRLANLRALDCLARAIAYRDGGMMAEARLMSTRGMIAHVEMERWQYVRKEWA